MKTAKWIPYILVVLFMCFGITACDVDEGPAEETEEAVEEAADDVEDSVEDMGDEMD